MRLIDRSRRVDGICAAGSWERISIRDSVNCQNREQTEEIKASIGFLTNILSFSTKKCLQPAQPSYFGCPKINYATLFSRISSWGFYEICSFFVSGTIIWLFIELSEQILIFLFFPVFFWWFWWENRRKPMYFLVQAVWTKKFMDFLWFSQQNHQKNQKKTKKSKSAPTVR